MTTSELAVECVKSESCDICIYIHECNKYRKEIKRLLSPHEGKYNLLLPQDLNPCIDKMVDLLHKKL